MRSNLHTSRVLEQTLRSRVECVVNEITKSGMINNVEVPRRQKMLCWRDALNALASLGLYWPGCLMEAGERELYMFFIRIGGLDPVPGFASPLLLVVSGVFRRALMG
jgi:hypothetical protein